MGFIGGIIALLVYFALIYLGAKAADINDVTYGRCIGVALLAWLFGFLLNILLWPLTNIWLIGGIIAVALSLLASAMGVRFVLKADWNSAFKVAIFVAVATAVLQIVGWLLKGIGGIFA